MISGIPIDGLIMEGVRDLEGFPVSLERDEKTGLITVVAINEGGFACTGVVLVDLLSWLGIDDAAMAAALALADARLSAKT